MGIEIDQLAKRYRDFTLREISFAVDPGEVVGFLGPNGAGKSTTLRLLLGLERADAGTARIDGLPYSQLRRPLLVCGSLIDSTWIYPRQSARHYLRWVAASNGLAVQRVDDALDRVGLTTVSRRQVAGLSMGMRQRLGLAAALLGDPAYLVFDEPLNGLDPEGIVWMRQLIRRLADEGRGVLLSSHQLGEVSQTADRVVMIAQGQLRGVGRVLDLTGGTGVRVRVSPARSALQALARRPELRVEVRAGGQSGAAAHGGSETSELVVTGADPAEVNRLLVEADVAVHALERTSSSLEDVFLQRLSPLTDYQGSVA
jgi:ABC-2 type transport system ATP-binding protein